MTDSTWKEIAKPLSDRLRLAYKIDNIKVSWTGDSAKSFAELIDGMAERLDAAPAFDARIAALERRAKALQTASQTALTARFVSGILCGILIAVITDLILN